jgi:hypothetical protein
VTGRQGLCATIMRGCHQPGCARRSRCNKLHLGNSALRPGGTRRR